MTIFFKLLLCSEKCLFILLFSLFYSCSTSPSYKEFYNDGISATLTGNLSEAVFNYEKSLVLKPSFHKARYNLILVLISEEDWEKVEINLNYLKNSLPCDNIFLLKIEAYYLFKQGKNEESFIIYNRLKELLPLDLEILYNLAYLNVVNQNNLRETYRLLQKINQVDPNFSGLKSSWVKSLGFSF